MVSTGDDRLLRETLSQAGIPDADSRAYEVIDSSGADEGGNARVHTATNTKIMDLLRDDELGFCIHVTGGARALTDPFHRQICEAMIGEGKDPFQVLFHLPLNRLQKPFDVVAHNLGQWKAKGFFRWQQRLLTIDMIGRKGVDLKGQEDDSGIQYSIFGNRFVQLQSAHSDTARAKSVWLIEAAGVHDFLKERALGALSKATEVDEGHFRDFNSALHSNSARAILKTVSRHDGIDRDGLLGDKRFWNFPEAPTDTLHALSLMDFLVDDPVAQLRVTEAGRDFLSQT